jgi:septum formation protein
LPLRFRPDGARWWASPERRLPPATAAAPLLLASVSPRRRELLRAAGLAYDAHDPGEDPPVAHLTGWRSAAARAVHKAARGAQAAPGRLSLGADTVVVWADQSLGKPANDAEASWMLEQLSGRTHEVFSAFGLALVESEEADSVRLLWLEIVRTEVRFRRLSAPEIAAYVASGAPRDKAGAYGIQDREHKLVESVRGSYYNVVGLPIRQVVAALAALGWHGPDPGGRVAPR